MTGLNIVVFLDNHHLHFWKSCIDATYYCHLALKHPPEFSHLGASPLYQEIYECCSCPQKVPLHLLCIAP